jgi:hypothetical protein
VKLTSIFTCKHVIWINKPRSYILKPCFFYWDSFIEHIQIRYFLLHVDKAEVVEVMLFNRVNRSSDIMIQKRTSWVISMMCYGIRTTQNLYLSWTSFCKERRFCPIKLVKCCRSLLKYPYQARIVSGLIFVYQGYIFCLFLRFLLLYFGTVPTMLYFLFFILFPVYGMVNKH